MSPIIRFAFIYLPCILLLSCQRDDRTGLVIDSAEPRGITSGTLVTVTGDGFGSDPSKAEIILVQASGNNSGKRTPVTPTAVSGSTMSFLVPELTAARYGLIVSYNDSADRLKEHFSYEELLFEKFWPRSTSVGKKVTVTLDGSGFSFFEGGFDVLLGDTILPSTVQSQNGSDGAGAGRHSSG